MAIDAQLQQSARLVDQTMTALLPNGDRDEARLFDAMRYGAFNGGKRIRPFLVLQSASLFGAGKNQALRTAAAIEFIHCYSLIHDDLPCMDDAELRRGKKTVHIAFDEETALLAGDALQSLAFEILADISTHPDGDVRCRLIAALAKASGAAGMAGGQVLDLLAEKSPLEQNDIKRLQRLKTGALIEFSCVAGAILADADDKYHEALRAYASAIGLAYQIVDDVLDATGNAHVLGKPAGQDSVRGKATFVSLWGLDRARAEAEALAEQAVRYLDIFGTEADTLRETAKYLVARNY